MRRIINAGVSLFIGLSVWELVCIRWPTLAFFLGRPTVILRDAVGLIASGALVKHFAVTFVETIVGLVAGICLALLMALFLWFSPRLGVFVEPHLRLAAALPTFALGPIIIFWCGTGFGSKLLLAFLPAFTTALVQAYQGIIELDANLLRLLRVFGASRSQVTRRLAGPAAVFAVLGGFRLSSSLALLGAFVGEFIASTAGLGHIIVVAEGLYDVSTMWVGIAGIVAIAAVLQAAGGALERSVVHWRSYARDVSVAGY
jgi:NitT/TauT family transport system permease protein